VFENEFFLLYLITTELIYIMDLNQFMESYAHEIGGQYSEYNNTVSIVIFPLADSRFQTVYGETKHMEKYGRELIEFSSKVCALDADVDLKLLLHQNTNFCHAKFSIVNNFIQVEASLFIDSATEETVKEAMSEVANLADEYEFILTGADVH
jgi:hypothetical protein